ncbi:elongation factor P--(R)-beta-lysine ligase [Aestuariibacter sp. AA17]|uniref:Elongation factor P--(R)-beta-lysine ligase n=1 Tax=Fluctibacter corallii TaxID=2984329 RepID=A0ABT3A4R0_9ALTE|nr:elongation factor P--(R)-beta-lysine ligase [Aestuariibacter sp. AA17]MCV2883577.1 elongation factor P--(R)-beta-lysine ligase [Aestuariibacter sp. AA17]
MWQPSATIKALRERAALIQSIRQFFIERDVLEVETPAFSAASVTDVHLHTFSTRFHHPLKPDAQTLYLQTSPEFAMKRLLCAGSGAIFQLSKAFRNEEGGRFHNPEFTMLEWYRPGFDHFALMNEVDALLQAVLSTEPADRMSYQEVFKTVLGIDPLTVGIEDLKSVCAEFGYADIAVGETDKDTLLQLLFSEQIEPKIGQARPVLVYHFLASQAALAKIDEQDPRVARRFEAYYKGIELANGFHELSDAQEQRSRFERDNQKRHVMGLPEMPIDAYFLEALESGLPDCAGVALGVDRLIMLALGASRISEVLAFDIDRA